MKYEAESIVHSVYRPYIFIGHSLKMLPFVVTDDLKGGNPKLYSEVSGLLTKEKDTNTTYSKGKPPKLYEQLLSLF